VKSKVLAATRSSAEVSLLDSPLIKNSSAHRTKVPIIDDQ
jgi:hypothetical protein